MRADQELVKKFHIAMDGDNSNAPNYPKVLDNETLKLRLNLIYEEAFELAEAMGVTLLIAEGDRSLRLEFGGEFDFIKIADSLSDLLVVTLGTAVSLGMDIEPFFHEVMRSNMTKVGGKKREDGKYLRGPQYQSANIKELWHKLYGEKGCK